MPQRFKQSKPGRGEVSERCWGPGVKRETITKFRATALHLPTQIK